MARLPIDGSRFVRILGKDVVQQNVLLVTTDDNGNGMMVANGVRAMPSDSIASLIDAWLQRSPSHTLGCIGHGIRLVADPVSGNGSPCFIERRGVASGTLYLFGCAGKRETVLAAFADAGITLVAADVEGGSKTGLRVTLPPDAEGSKVLDVLEKVAFVSTGLVGWDAGPLAIAMCSHNGAPYMAPKAKVAKGTEQKAATEDKQPKVNKAKSGKKAKQPKDSDKQTIAADDVGTMPETLTA